MTGSIPRWAPSSRVAKSWKDWSPPLPEPHGISRLAKSFQNSHFIFKRSSAATMAAPRARHCFALLSKHLLECAGVPLSLKPGQSLSSQSSIAAISPGLSSDFNQRSFASGGAHNLPDDFARYQEHRTHKFSGLPTLLKAPLADTLEGVRHLHIWAPTLAERCACWLTGWVHL
jgi:hypothetical protein